MMGPVNLLYFYSILYSPCQDLPELSNRYGTPIRSFRLSTDLPCYFNREKADKALKLPALKINFVIGIPTGYQSLDGFLFCVVNWLHFGSKLLRLLYGKMLRRFNSKIKELGASGTL